MLTGWHGDGGGGIAVGATPVPTPRAAFRLTVELLGFGALACGGTGMGADFVGSTPSIALRFDAGLGMTPSIAFNSFALAFSEVDAETAFFPLVG